MLTLTFAALLPRFALCQQADASSSSASYQLACVVDRTAVHVFSLPHPAASTSSSSSSSPPAPSSVILLPESSPSQLAARRHQVSVQAALRSAQRNERHNHSAEGKKKRHNSATAMAASTVLETGAAATGGEEIVCIDFISDSQLLLVRGDRDRCVFNTVSYRGEGEDGGWVAELVLEPAADGLLQPEAKQGEGQRKKVSDSEQQQPPQPQAAVRAESEHGSITAPLVLSSEPSQISLSLAQQQPAAQLPAHPVFPLLPLSLCSAHMR